MINAKGKVQNDELKESSFFLFILPFALCLLRFLDNPRAATYDGLFGKGPLLSV